VHGMTGLLVPVGDAAALADALRTLEPDADLRERLGAAACEAVRTRYRQDVVIGKLSALYEMLAHGRVAASARRAHG